MSEINFKDFKKKALTDSEVKKEYDLLTPAYELRKRLIRLRKEAGLTQEEMARLLNTKKSNISRLENVNSKISTTISTIEKYARAIGYNIDINFIPLSTHKNRQSV
jgi:transcriptional regulator with XRE-family HTH domain